MNVWLVAVGALLLAAGLLDALWTTLWPEGHAGPLSGRLSTAIHRLFRLLSGASRHRAGPRVNNALMSLQGPVALIASVLLWQLLLWAGWTVLFSAVPGSLAHSRTGAAATLADRVYFVGYSMFTLGNGDYAPQGPRWQLATALASLTGFAILTLTITYVLSVVEAAVAKRSFATQVFALGGSAEEFVCNAWDGREFRGLDLQLFSLVEQLNTITEHHRAYPMLHYYHAADERNAAPSAAVVFDEALTLLRLGVAAEARPSPSALRCGHEAVRDYLDTLRSAHIEPAPAAPAPPVLARVRAAGVPTVDDEMFTAAVGGLDERRRTLQGLLDDDAREWPAGRG